jgi:CRISPR/Cas system-associated exonuclease Cas4 (RecB family)
MEDTREAILKQLIKEAVKIVEDEVDTGMRCSACPLQELCSEMFADCPAVWEVK